MGMTCKNCNIPNHFAKMCCSQQVNEVTEENLSLGEDCNLIHSFDLCKIEIMAIETRSRSVKDENNSRTKTEAKVHHNKFKNIQNIWKIDIRRNPQSNKVKAMKALVRVSNQIISMAIDTGRPVSFLNCTTAEQLLEGSSVTKVVPAEKLNLSAQFVDRNNYPILILGAIQANIRLACWEVKNGYLLITELRARYILGLDLRGKTGIHTSQRPVPTKRSRFDVLLCEQSEGFKQHFEQSFLSIFDHQRESKNHVVNTKFKYPLCPIEEKGRRILIHIQDKVQAELRKMKSEGQIMKLDKCTSECFIAPIVFTEKTDDSVKLALDAMRINF